MTARFMFFYKPGVTADEVEDDVNMNAVHDEIAYACFLAQRWR